MNAGHGTLAMRPGGPMKLVTQIGLLVVLAWALHELVFFHDATEEDQPAS